MQDVTPIEITANTRIKKYNAGEIPGIDEPYETLCHSEKITGPNAERLINTLTKED
jgi:hypothetical protein